MPSFAGSAELDQVDEYPASAELSLACLSPSKAGSAEGSSCATELTYAGQRQYDLSADPCPADPALLGTGLLGMRKASLPRKEKSCIIREKYTKS
jgi:hypothetical protein